MNANEMLKDAAIENAAAVDGLIAELTAAVAKLQAARSGFATATTWAEFDNALSDVESAVAHLPKHRDDATTGIVKDPT